MKPNRVWFVALVLLQGCIVGGHSHHPPPDGDLVVDWTISDSRNPDNCALTHSATAHVDVLDDNNVKANAGADTQDCAAFSTSFNFSFTPGNYTVRVTLQHADGTPSTTTAQGRVAIFSGETDSIAFDYSPSSFF